ncbi:MAG: hypothetical protein LBI87_02195 [Candidatus Accumulibacter sp.]|jgi:hypothetical protein|nr:hypothetical protein [Accumulibacter sp.]
MKMTTKRIIAASAIGAALTLLLGALAFFHIKFGRIFFIHADFIMMAMNFMGLERQSMHLAPHLPYYVPPARWVVSAVMWEFVFSVMTMRIISQKDRSGGFSVECFYYAVWQVLNTIAAIATLYVVGFGIAFAADAGRKGLWYFAGVGIFIAAIVAIFRNINYSLLYLLLACAFSFSSCVANFRWYGG